MASDIFGNNTGWYMTFPLGQETGRGNVIYHPLVYVKGERMSDDIL